MVVSVVSVVVSVVSVVVTVAMSVVLLWMALFVAAGLLAVVKLIVSEYHWNVSIHSLKDDIFKQ